MILGDPYFRKLPYSESLFTYSYCSSCIKLMIPIYPWPLSEKGLNPRVIITPAVPPGTAGSIGPLIHWGYEWDATNQLGMILGAPT